MADATGDAVAISAGPDGELAITKKPKGDGYLLSTNFNLANPKNTFEGGYPCWLYNKADEMLKKIESEKDLTTDYFRSILDAVHIEGAVGNTLYSNVYNLMNGVIYLYYWHLYDETAILNIAEEIAKLPSPSPIKKLFSPVTIQRAEKEHQDYKDRDKK